MQPLAPATSRILLASLAITLYTGGAFAQTADSTAAWPAPVASRTASSVPQWEFGRFTHNFGGGGYSWVTSTERFGDNNYRKFLAQLGLIGLLDHPSREMAVLGALGMQGWELVTCQTARTPGVLSDSDVNTCYFKRRRDAAPVSEVSGQN